ncbi:hypothetical protein PHYNN_81 [Pantoea phage Phynn]|nr:hypothetical protein PHYNN_81 [Pantoea phage Phynn]
MKKNSLSETLLGCLLYAFYERKVWLGVSLALFTAFFCYVTVTSFIFTVDFLRNLTELK